ncbi:MAG: DNA glycosylase AlkZ-like family protein, partial [Clostridia bacterium]
MSGLLPARFLRDSLRPAAGESIADTVHRLGAVQMDPVQVVAPAHLWTISLRRGPTSSRDLADALYAGAVLEAFTHARCLVATADAAALVRQWRHRRARNAVRVYGVEREAREVLQRIEHEPHLAARNVVTDRRVTGGWDAVDQQTAKPTTVALDILWAEGRLVVSDRGPEGKRYELLARRHPEIDTLIETLPDDEALWASLRHAARSWKVYRPAWASPGFGRGTAEERRRWHAWLLESGEVRQERWGDETLYIHQSIQDAVDEPDRARILAPLDNVLWSRARLEKLF